MPHDEYGKITDNEAKAKYKYSFACCSAKCCAWQMERRPTPNNNLQKIFHLLSWIFAIYHIALIYITCTPEMQKKLKQTQRSGMT